ncbi:MAG: nucleoside hydrolase [Spirochaetaceae bacterium]|nr:MAG: nucleoside hydrolase [Spirochaetaceae bacterium]
MATPVLLDCDPGHDDMMAILLALAHPGIELLGVTTVAGNQTVDRTWYNAARTLTLVGATDIPLARGADAPLCRPLVTAADIHGTSGLDGANLPEPDLCFGMAGEGGGGEGGSASPPQDHGLPAPAFLAERILAHPRPVTLVPTGPLTNIALALRTYPELKDRIERIVLMGGGLGDSNITPAAEFNIYVDPEAAEAVFQGGIPIRMVTVDVTNRALMSREQIEALAAGPGRIARTVGGLMRFFADAYRARFRIDGAPIHDALTVATVIDPSLVETRPCNVVVETQGRYTRGRTVVDVYGVTGRPLNADVTFSLDRERFMQLMMEAVATLDGR